MILLYKGKSYISWRIKMGTLSQYSHASWLKTTTGLREQIRQAAFTGELRDDVKQAVINAGCIEAWHSGNGVRETYSLREGHMTGTEIDVYDVPGLDEFKFSIVEQKMREEIGLPYWFKGILYARFNTFLKKSPPMDASGDPAAWFCSMICEDKLREVDFPLVNTRIPTWGVWPGSLGASVHLNYQFSVKI